VRPADVHVVVQRLHEEPLTGQVVAWGWDTAARLSATRRTPPVALLAALWPATSTVACRCTAQDLVDIVESWLILTQRWPRHFRFAPEPLDVLIETAIPAAVKRMNEERLIRFVNACRDIALHRPDPSDVFGQRGRSARDLLQPVFSLLAAETAWRVADDCNSVSYATLRLVLSASAAWRWTPIVHRDSPELAAVKAATRASLDVIRKGLVRPGRPAQSRSSGNDMFD
jgi:hypothetical protein